MSSEIEIVEVGLRDGLQNETVVLDLTNRLTLFEKLLNAGLKRIEVGAFVSPVWVPQMAFSKNLVLKLIQLQEVVESWRQVHISALVPNEKGMRAAVETKIPEVAIFAAASETFSYRNINCGIDESLKRFEPIMTMAKSNGIKVRGYLSTVFGCPYEGEVPIAKVVELVRRLFECGVYELSLGDTIGVATPRAVRNVVKAIFSENKDWQSQLALHFHDTRGMALVNIASGLELGIKVFDSSICGLGGCPYAAGASGNVATEEVVFFLESEGIKTGIDVAKLIEIAPWLSDRMQKVMPSKLARAGLYSRG